MELIRTVPNLGYLIHRAQELGFTYPIKDKDGGVEVRYMGMDIYLEEERAIQFFQTFVANARPTVS